MSKPFGYSYLIDMHGCKPGSADDMELTYRFLERLVVLLDMTPMSPPFVIHAPRDRQGNELFTDKAGVSGWVPLVESGIQIHSLEPSHFITLDVYSCKPFDPRTVWEFAKQTFEFASAEEHYIERGIHYASR
jgi:S-adenosylmethionine decarboxylase